MKPDLACAVQRCGDWTDAFWIQIRNDLKQGWRWDKRSAAMEYCPFNRHPSHLPPLSYLPLRVPPLFYDPLPQIQLEPTVSGTLWVENHAIMIALLQKNSYNQVCVVTRVGLRHTGIW